MIRAAAVLLLGLTALTSSPSPAAAQRQRLSMDPGWRFALGDPAGAVTAATPFHGPRG